MKKSKIFIYHLIIFLIGSVGLVVYTFVKLSSNIGGVIAMPVTALFYVVGFGILCLISMAICFLIARFRRKETKAR